MTPLKKEGLSCLKPIWGTGSKPHKTFSRAPDTKGDTFPLIPLCCLFFHLFGLKSFTIIHIFFLYINYEMLYHISEDIERNMQYAGIHCDKGLAEDIPHVQ